MLAKNSRRRSRKRHLARADHNLRSPLHLSRAISTIAFDLGFNDLSYFSRAFRWRYSATPSEIRNGVAPAAHQFRTRAPKTTSIS
ncbi:helix-turn-helix domain-containing protein [Bradyrhizobium sp. SEMIA]|uniref:helix-turn-helix domain-containing protein n=1 Tax=Bradyrhizobium sp. SEMIA TaxID=2597515 RepID=UPI0018A42BC2|nr:helix-turn-helix domain-containing protein [Bradyrhizobium sp. SEMIA]QOG19151.1 helix-turn-helix domain-containing protein [Bradyrhizobium sp. SEMIA]